MNSELQSRVLDILTLEGTIPEECSFVMGAFTYVWIPEVQFRTLAIHSDELNRACREYLLAQGRVFASYEEAEKVVISEKWPGWEQLVAPNRHKS